MGNTITGLNGISIGTAVTQIDNTTGADGTTPDGAFDLTGSVFNESVAGSLIGGTPGQPGTVTAGSLLYVANPGNTLAVGTKPTMSANETDFLNAVRASLVADAAKSAAGGVILPPGTVDKAVAAAQAAYEADPTHFDSFNGPQIARYALGLLPSLGTPTT